ncbi:unnamed protein product [Urochloa humidicola]
MARCGRCPNSITFRSIWIEQPFLMLAGPLDCAAHQLPEEVLEVQKRQHSVLIANTSYRLILKQIDMMHGHGSHANPGSHVRESSEAAVWPWRSG